jgi:membrane-associated protein
VVSFVEQIIKAIAPAYTTAGYAIIAAGVLAERSILVGLFVPGDVILALGGVYAARGSLELWAVIVIGTFAAIIGESTGYWLGRRYGRGLVKRIPVVARLEGRLDGAHEYFQKHGGKTVALGRYATAAGAFIPFVAGMSKMDYRRFLMFDVPAVVVWAVGITLFGYFFGEHVGFIDHVLSRFGLIMLGILVVGLGGYLLYRRRKRSS